MTALQKTILATTIAATLGTAVYETRQASQWRKRVRVLEQQQAPLEARVHQLQHALETTTNLAVNRISAPRLPAPRLPGAPSTSAPPGEPIASANVYALATNQQARLTTEQLDPYLNTNRRSAASLLAAFRTSGDPTFLEEAMQKYPGDPQVNFEAALRKDASSEERRRWLDAFKQSATENALADYLSAREHFKSGEIDQAVQDLIVASGKSRFADYTLERVQDDEEAYRAADYPTAQAKVVATFHILLPQLVEMRDLSQNLLDLASTYRQSGDDSSSQATLRMAVNLGRRYGDGGAGETLVSQLVGLAIERDALKVMDSNGLYDASGQTIQQRLEQLAQQRATIKELVKQADALWPTMSDQDWISYHTRSAAFGEEAALRWAVGKFGPR